LGHRGFGKKIAVTQKQEDENIVRCASLFSQLIALFSRRKFYDLVFEHSAERFKYLQFKSKFPWSLSNLVAFLRWTSLGTATYGSGLTTRSICSPCSPALSKIYCPSGVLDSISGWRQP